MDYVIAGIATLFLFGYLIYALLKLQDKIDQMSLAKRPTGCSSGATAAMAAGMTDSSHLSTSDLLE